jgi:hypothetical protein
MTALSAAPPPAIPGVNWTPAIGTGGCCEWPVRDSVNGSPGLAGNRERVALHHHALESGAVESERLRAGDQRPIQEHVAGRSGEDSSDRQEPIETA